MVDGGISPRSGASRGDDSDLDATIGEQTSDRPSIAAVVSSATDDGDCREVGVDPNLFDEMGDPDRGMLHQEDPRHPQPLDRGRIEQPSGGSIEHQIKLRRIFRSPGHRWIVWDAASRPSVDPTIRVDSYHARPMSLAISVTTIIFAVLAAATAIYWGFVFGRLVRLSRHTPELRDGLQLAVVDEMVSIIVPAHDEARVIDRMVRSMRSQEDMKIELIVVLDRCTDDTFDRLTAAADGDPRVRIVVNDACPEGWAGKCNAAAVGAAEATGDWVLFTDADVHFDPGVVRAAVSIAAENKVDLLSAYTRLTSGHWWEIIVQPPAAITLLRMFPPDRVNHEERPRSFANGQFMLFRRESYDRLGGHAVVKDDLLEDLAFAKAVHRTGGRVRVVHSDTMIQTSMYESLEDLLSGWRRIFIESCHRNIGRLNRNVIRVAGAGLGPVASLFGVLMGFLSLGQDEYWIGIAGIAGGVSGVAISGMTLAVIFGRGGMPRIGILGWPIGCLLVAGTLRRGAVDLAKGRPIRWGGREYVIEPGG